MAVNPRDLAEWQLLLKRGRIPRPLQGLRGDFGVQWWLDMLESLTDGVGSDLPGLIVAAGGGGAGAVSSVFTRTGAVIAAVSDYDASQVDNDSGVAGAQVSNALDTLASLIGGNLVSSRFASFTPRTTTILNIPIDDTIPQRTEGLEVIALPSFSPASASNILLAFSHIGVVSKTSAGVVSGTIFTDQSLDAFAGSTVRVQVINSTYSLTCVGSIVAGTTSPIIVSLRVGQSTGGGTMQFNGTNVSVWNAMANKSFLAVLELTP